MLTEDDQTIEICKENFQSDQQNIAPIECYEMENKDFP